MTDREQSSATDAVADLLADLREPERTHFLCRLGEGAVGRVDRVFDARLGRVVARKTLRPDRRDDESAVRIFVNEARILAQLDHGSILPVFDTYLNEEGLPAYTMPEISGTGLAELLRIDSATGAARVLPLERTLVIVGQLCDALAHAHDRGVIHLDLKPENVVVLEHDRIVLVDWGAARLYDPTRARRRLVDSPEFETMGRIEDDDELLVGTPRYMSPEQTIARRSELGPESDVFSLGVLFYQMLTGRLPFEETALEPLLRSIRELAPTPPRQVAAGVHPRLGQIVMRMLEKQEWDRFPSMTSILEALRAFRSTGAEFPLREYAAGELLFREGDSADFAGVIVSGEVEVWTAQEETGGRRVLGRLLAGESIGELALLSGGERSASATALVPTSLRIISEPALVAEVEKLSPWVLAILTGVVERFVDRSDRLVELLRSEPESAASEEDPEEEGVG